MHLTQPFTEVHVYLDDILGRIYPSRPSKPTQHVPSSSTIFQKHLQEINMERIFWISDQRESMARCWCCHHTAKPMFTSLIWLYVFWVSNSVLIPSHFILMKIMIIKSLFLELNLELPNFFYLREMTFPNFHLPISSFGHHMRLFRKNNLCWWQINLQPWQESYKSSKFWYTQIC